MPQQPMYAPFQPQPMDMQWLPMDQGDQMQGAIGSFQNLMPQLKDRFRRPKAGATPGLHEAGHMGGAGGGIIPNIAA